MILKMDACKTDWIQIIINLKIEKANEHDFITASQFREIERWLKFNHSIEEIFENKNAYNEVVKKELIKLERRKKIEKINDKRRKEDNNG